MKNNKKKTGSKRPQHGKVQGFKHSKRLGQNFLTDSTVIEEIVNGSGVNEESLVIEIGPGQGVLTEALADRAGHVIAIELDDRLISILRVTLYNRDNVEIVHGDILETDLRSIISEALLQKTGLNNVRIVGNLPYYITTPIIMKLLEEEIPADSITVMVQKEVGERLAAVPGERETGAVTYTVHYYCDVTRICDVGKECFDPVPKVDSMVIRLDRLGEPPVQCDAARMFRIIKAGFMMRRKTLLNALAMLPAYSKEEIGEALAACGIEPERRAESLTLEDFAALANALERA